MAAISDTAHRLIDGQPYNQKPNSVAGASASITVAITLLMEIGACACGECAIWFMLSPLLLLMLLLLPHVLSLHARLYVSLLPRRAHVQFAQCAHSVLQPIFWWIPVSVSPAPAPSIHPWQS